jgi:hypothetical protein
MIADRLAFQLLGRLFFLFPKEMRRRTAVGVCIKEKDIDCAWLLLLWMKNELNDKKGKIT